MLNSTHAELMTQALKSLFGKSFGEDISELIVGGDKRRNEKISSEGFPDDMILNINVLCATMELRVLDETKCTLIVGKQWSGGRKRLPEAGEQSAMPNDFFGSGGSRKVFSLCGTASATGLLARSPEYWTMVDKKYEPGARFAIIKIHGEICITVSRKG